MRVLDVENIPIVGVNGKYILSRGRLVLTSKYRDYKKTIAALARKKHQFVGDLEMTIRFSSRHDIDNPCKPLIDALQDAGIYANDRQIKRLIVENDGKNSGRLTVDVEEISKK